MKPEISGGFTSEAEAEIRRSSRHVEKMDLSDLIKLWDDHFDRMMEKDRRLMPIRKIAFLAPDENVGCISLACLCRTFTFSFHFLRWFPGY